MREVWIRNEWLLTTNGWAQESFAVRNMVSSDHMMRALVTGWNEHTWFVHDDFVLGLPAAPTKQYLVTFHKEMR